MNKTNPVNNQCLSPRFDLRRVIFLMASLLSLGLALCTRIAQAQSISVKQPQIRVTVPLNTTLTTVVTGQVSRVGIDNSGVALNVSGVPAGAGAVISPTSVSSNNTPYTITLSTTNIAQGLYILSVNASGLDTNALPVTNHYSFQLHSGHFWNGTTNAANDGAGNWSDSAQWLGGVPTTGDEVIFTDLGGQ